MEITKAAKRKNEEYRKLIIDTADAVLSPEGLFRKDGTRIWFDDNIYFVTIVEFQKSQFGTKGIFLNVGISFLWEFDEVRNYMLLYNYGYRVEEFALYYGNKEKFAEYVKKYSKSALKEVAKYRKFSNLDYAKKLLVKDFKKKYEDINPPFWEAWNLAMLCFYKNDYSDGKKYLDFFVNHMKENLADETTYHPIGVAEELAFCENEILPKCGNAQDAHQMVVDMITRRRGFFKSRPAYGGLKDAEIK